MTAIPDRTKPKRAKLRDVAERAGVDASLVSRVLNDHPRASAGPATRLRIIEAARELGYQPNVAARGLRTDKTWTLGLLLPNLTNPLYATMAHACARRAQERGYGLVFGTHVEGEDEAPFARMIQQGRVDGLLTASGVLGDAFLRRIATGAIGPLVMLNRRVRGVRTFVTVDDTAGAAMATRHLASLGHTEVAGIFGPGAIDTTTRRRAGFEEAGRRTKLRLTIIEEAGLDRAAGAAAAAKIFREHREVTGVFASTFAIATGVLRAARLAGVRIPDDVSLVGLHDSELADYLAPTLTTVRLPVEEMAARAVDLLVDLIDGGDQHSVALRTPPVLVTRELTARPRKVKRLTPTERSR